VDIGKISIGRWIRCAARAWKASLVLVLAPVASLGQTPPTPSGAGKFLPIVNAGFEEDFTPPGCFTVVTPVGWDLYDPENINGGNDAIGVIDPTDTTNFPEGAPEGVNVALVFLDGDVGVGPMGLSQPLVDTLEANTTYTLSVQVGDIASGIGPPPCDVFGFFDLEGFPGYRIELLAGGALLVEDDNLLAAVLKDGEFGLSEIFVTIGADHEQLGEPLEIRLINLNMPGTEEAPGIEVDFDDVRLFAAPVGAAVPTVSEWGLVIMSLVILSSGTVVLRGRRGSRAGGIVA
jgi:hypothetical protein